MQSMVPKPLEARIAALKVLVVDDDQYMRKVVRTMLTVIGVKHVFEAVDGPAGLEAVREILPDIVLVDWEMPMLDGPQFVRIIRAPGSVLIPEVPIIMLTGHGDRWRVIEAARVGVHEYLLKPVSTKALLDRIVSVLTNPRPLVQLGDYVGPEPRKLVIVSGEPDVDPRGKSNVVLVH
jgi:two-component system, chemotaxis family, chemotaxis protein CheY